ncbi:hypothetical protein [Streptomyces sp. 8N706]|uniref:hypothetical protein n=1 Tax=Streptomyces sp. 8N706 TaxID=3457416 RepID=UPI003FD5F7A3
MTNSPSSRKTTASQKNAEAAFGKNPEAQQSAEAQQNAEARESAAAGANTETQPSAGAPRTEAAATTAGTRTPGSRKASSPSRAKAAARSENRGTEQTPEDAEKSDRRTVTITLPSFDRVASRAANAAMLPVAAARQVLPAKGGLPVYVGLGVLGIADVIEWPVAVGIGVGYAVLRRQGVLPSEPVAAKS